jgi:hypothetical protein
MKKNVTTWRGSKHKAFTFMQQLVKPYIICKTHFFIFTRFTHDYESFLWFFCFVYCLKYQIYLYNLLGVYMEVYKSCGQHKLLVMEVIMMSSKHFC